MPVQAFCITVEDNKQMVSHLITRDKVEKRLANGGSYKPKASCMRVPFCFP